MTTTAPSQPQTCAQLLLGGAGNGRAAPGRVAAMVRARTERAAAEGEDAAPRAPAAALSAIRKKVCAEAIDELKQDRLVDRFAQGWAAVQRVQDAARRSVAEPDTDVHESLGAHTNVFRHIVTVELRVHGEPVLTATLPAELEVAATAVRLTLRNGSVTAASADSASATATIRLEETPLLTRSVEIDLSRLSASSWTCRRGSGTTWSTLHRPTSPGRLCAPRRPGGHLSDVRAASSAWSFAGRRAQHRIDPSAGSGSDPGHDGILHTCILPPGRAVAGGGPTS